jgi:hypothetical protein
VALNHIRVLGSELAASPSSRLDVRYHLLMRLVQPFFQGLERPVRLVDVLDAVANGVNLPASLYADDLTEATALYASVTSLSQFALREASCVPLVIPERFLVGNKLTVEQASAQRQEVLLTRSGTPGIAWPATLAPEGLPVIPSGFLIRLLLAKGFDPIALAAILNHPCWRLLTLALSAGKRQDNIGQPALAAILLPRLNESQQTRITQCYTQTLNQIRDILAEEPFMEVCDNILSDVLQLPSPPIESRAVMAAVVSLEDVAATPSLRADNRWHGVPNRLVRGALAEESVPLGSVVGGMPVKGRQPDYLEEAEDGAFAIATGTLQAGQVALDLAKPVTLTSAARFPVQSGQLLVAMDGDGSLGKAGVVGPSDAELTVDTHIAKVPVNGSPDLNKALACWLNSTWGRTQTAGLMTGATGQTQLRPTDLLRVLVPQVLVDRPDEVASAYQNVLTTFDTPARHARQAICDGSAEITEILMEEGTLRMTKESSATYNSPTALRTLLDLAYPSTGG